LVASSQQRYAYSLPLAAFSQKPTASFKPITRRKDDQNSMDELEELLPGKALKHRPSPLGEGKGMR